jgi:hypothetical protein
MWSDPLQAQSLGLAAQQPAAVQGATAMPDPLHAQALALAARLSPQANQARNSFGGAPGGVNMGAPHANPLVPRNPWASGQVPGGAPAVPGTNLQGNLGTTASLLGRWSSPQSGATLG